MANESTKVHSMIFTLHKFVVTIGNFVVNQSWDSKVAIVTWL